MNPSNSNGSGGGATSNDGEQECTGTPGEQETFLHESGACVSGLSGAVIGEELTPYDPECESVAAKNGDAELQAEIDKIKARIGEPREYGFRERPNDPDSPNDTERFVDLEPFPNDPTKLNITANRRNIHVVHYHPAKFKEDADGNFDVGRLTLSPKDVNVFIGTLYGASLDPTLDPVKFDLANFSTTIITERGVFTLKFKGDANDIFNLALQVNNNDNSNRTSKKIRRRYTRGTNKEPEEALLQHLKFAYGDNALNLFGLYKTNENGSIEEYKLDENEKLEEPTICHEG